MGIELSASHKRKNVKVVHHPPSLVPKHTVVAFCKGRVANAGDAKRDDSPNPVGTRGQVFAGCPGVGQAPELLIDFQVGRKKRGEGPAQAMSGEEEFLLWIPMRLEGF